MSPHLSGSRHAHVPAKPIGCSRARHIFAVNRIPNTPTENAEDHMGTLISFKRPDGQEAKGYLAKAA
ncbi:MAG: hypothetical protein E6833_34030, partial [Bradyrhizobium sp.]|nr:hypothetical protein [Bradyrhizobium sp.]